MKKQQPEHPEVVLRRRVDELEDCIDELATQIGTLQNRLAELEYHSCDSGMD